VIKIEQHSPLSSLQQAEATREDEKLLSLDPKQALADPEITRRA